ADPNRSTHRRNGTTSTPLLSEGSRAITVRFHRSTSQGEVRHCGRVTQAASRSGPGADPKTTGRPQGFRLGSGPPNVRSRWREEEHMAAANNGSAALRLAPQALPPSVRAAQRLAELPERALPPGERAAFLPPLPPDGA